MKDKIKIIDKLIEEVYKRRHGTGGATDVVADTLNNQSIEVIEFIEKQQKLIENQQIIIDQLLNDNKPPCVYFPDGSTSMNCKWCGKSQYLHTIKN